MELEKYRQPWETGCHWELKKEFLQYYKDFFPEDKLLCLAQVYTNSELLRCRYPRQVMTQIQKLVKHLRASKIATKYDYRESKLKIKPKGIKKAEEPRVMKYKISESKVKKVLPEFVPLPPGLEEVTFKSIAQSENFEIVKKLTVEVQKILKLQEGNALDIIQSASLHLNIEDMVDFKYTQVPTGGETEKYFCEFLVGTSKLGIGEGENRYIAKKSASEKVLDTLSNLPLIEKLGTEIKKLLEVERNARDMMISAALHLGMDDLFNLKFTSRINEESGPHPRVFCELFIGATKIADASSTTKVLAKKKAWNVATYILTELKDLPTGDLEQVRLQWVRNSKCQLEKKINTPEGKWNKELLEKVAFEIKREKLAKQQAMAALNAAFGRVGRLKDLVFYIYEDESVPFKGEPIFVCDALVNYVPMATAKAASKKKARRLAGQRLMEFFSDLFDRKLKSSDASENIYADVLLLIDQHSHKTNFIMEGKVFMNPKTRTVEKEKPLPIAAVSIGGLITVEKENEKAPVASCSNEGPSKKPGSSFSVNERLYKNSIKQNLLLYDMSDIPSDKKITHIGKLSESVQQCRRVFCLKYSPHMLDTFRVDVLLDGKVIGFGIATGKFNAKNEAARLILEKLEKEIYTVKVKKSDNETFVINPCDLDALRFDTPKPASETKSGSRKSGFRKSGSKIPQKEEINTIICPLNDNFARCFQYYAALSKKVNLRTRHSKLDALFYGYSRSDSVIPLAFSPSFSPSDKKMIHLTARKFGLVSNKCAKKNDIIFVKRRLSIKEFLDFLIKARGRTSKYELVDLST